MSGHNFKIEFAMSAKLDFIHAEIGASADLRMDKVTFNC